MVQEVISFLQNKIPDELVVFIISMLPVLELRGGLIAAAILNVNWLVAFPICVIGNILPIPLELLFIRKIFNWLKRFKCFKTIIEKLDKRAKDKASSEAMQKYLEWGIFILVAVPLPGTGAWTGGLVADVLDLRMKKAIPIITYGVISAGLITSFFSYVLPYIIEHIF